MPVVVDIDPHSRHRPEWTVLFVGQRKASLFRHVGKGAVAVVVIKSVAIDPGHEDVVVAVVIVVTDGNADIEAGAFQSDLFRHVGKGTVAIVVEEAVPIFGRIFGERVDRGTVDEKDVWPAVAVVIEDGNAASHRLRSMASW